MFTKPTLYRNLQNLFVTLDRLFWCLSHALRRLVGWIKKFLGQDVELGITMDHSGTSSTSPFHCSLMPFQTLPTSDPEFIAS
jgi:hypothetical protein